MWRALEVQQFMVGALLSQAPSWCLGCNWSLDEACCTLWKGRFAHPEWRAMGGGEASSRINVHINDHVNRPLHAFKDTGGWDCFWNLTAHGSYHLISPAPCTFRTFPLSAGSAQHINVHCIPTWVLGTTVIKIAAIRILHVVLFRIRLIWAPFCRQNLSPHGLVRLLTLRHNRRLRVAGYCRADRFLLMSVASEQPWARSHLQGGANRTPQSNLDQEQ